MRWAIAGVNGRRQKLRPARKLALQLIIAFDAVMRDPIPLEPAPTPEIRDTIQVNPVDLTAYDALCGQRREVSA